MEARRRKKRMRRVVMVALNNNELVVRHIGIDCPCIVHDLLNIVRCSGAAVIVAAAKDSVRSGRIASRHHPAKNFKIMHGVVAALKV